MTTVVFIITSNNKTLQSLRSHSCLHLLQRWNNGGLMTAHSGGSKVKCSIKQSNIRGGPGSVWRHTDNKLRMAWFEKGVIILVDKKKHWVDFYHYRVVVYAHCQHTFMFKQHVKMHFASNGPFNSIVVVSLASC